MKTMTEYQCRLVEENLDIVDWVIRYRIIVTGKVLQTYEDYYQIGCEALCRAALAYRPEDGTFSPLGIRYVYNAIIDHCRKQNGVAQFSAELTDENGEKDFLFDAIPRNDEVDELIYSKQVRAAFHKCMDKHDGIIRRGMEALELKSIGFTTREIAERYQTSVNNVNAWISRARTYLCSDPDILAVLS